MPEFGSSTVEWPVTAAEAVRAWEDRHAIVHFRFGDTPFAEQHRDVVIWALRLLVRQSEQPATIYDHRAEGYLVPHDAATDAVRMAGAAMGFFVPDEVAVALGTLCGTFMADGWRETMRQFHPSLWSLYSRPGLTDTGR